MRAAVFLAILAGLVTFSISVWNGSRLLTAVQRSGISAAIFGCCGFLFSSIIEPHVRAILNNINPTGKNIDIISDRHDDNISIVTEEQPEAEFRPFSPDTVKRVYRNS